MDCATGRTIAWVTGNRDIGTFEKLYAKFKHLINCQYFTDNWEVFKTVLAQEKHFIGKELTPPIERDNSNTRHHLGRFHRRTKIVSQQEYMVNASIKLWIWANNPNIKEKLITIFLSGFINS